MAARIRDQPKPGYFLCPGCNKVKPREAFYGRPSPDSRSGVSTRCKACHNARSANVRLALIRADPVYHQELIETSRESNRRITQKRRSEQRWRAKVTPGYVGSLTATGLTQRQLSGLIGVGWATISAWHTGRWVPTSRTFSRLIELVREIVWTAPS